MARQSLNATRIHLLVPNAQLSRLTSLADKHGLPRSEILRRAITYYLGAVSSTAQTASAAQHDD